MVTKTKFDFETTVSAYCAYIGTPGTTNQEFLDKSWSFRTYKIVDTVGNRGYKRQLGVSNATTPYSIDSQRIKESVPLDYSHYCNAYPKLADEPWRGTFYIKGFPSGVPPSVSHLPVPSVTSAAIGRLYGKIRDASQSFSGGIFIAELSDTLRMLRNPFASVIKLNDAFLKRSRSIRASSNSAAIKRKALADSYLEYTFGILPLIGDIDDILNLAADRERDVKTVKVSSYEEIRDAETAFAPNHLISDLEYHTFQKTTTTQRVIASAGLNPLIDGTPLSAQSFGVSARDIPLAIYNGIPFTFVLDYFTNVGQILNYYTTCTDRVIWTSLTEITETTVELSTVPLPYSNDGVDSFPTSQIQGKLVLEKFNLQRVPTLSAPSLTLSLPNIKQSVNLGALLISFHKLK